MGARARDRQKRAGARSRALARAGRRAARASAGRESQGQGGTQRVLSGFGGPGASRGVDPPPPPGGALPDLLRGGGVCFRARSRSLLTSLSPFSPGGHTAVGN